MSAPTREPLELSSDEKAAILNRLRRAHGQIAGVLRMVEEDRDCRDIVTQLSAARKALDRSGFALINGGLRRCLSRADAGGAEQLKDLERLFLHLT